jgi:lysine 2,3-aminomutase
MGKQVVVVIHIDHPHEITSEFMELVRELRSAGCMLLSQTVLLKRVNADRATLHQLFRGLLNSGVKPYYLHHLDQVYGSHHFRVSIEAGKKLYQSLRGHLSGAALPEYVLDLTGGFGKVPVMWLEHAGKDHNGKQCYETTTFEGHRVQYVDQAEDDNLS